MTLDQLGQALGMTWQDLDNLRPTWDQAQAAFDPAMPWFLDESAIERETRWLKWTGELAELAIQTRRQIAQNRPLQHLLWHGLWQSVGPLAKRPCPSLFWPTLGAIADTPAARFIQGLWGLALLTHVRAIHRNRGISETITRNTLGDFSRWAEHHRKTRGLLGFDKSGWLANHLTGRLYELGRLQFGIAGFTLDVLVLRWRRSPSRVVSLARHGLWIDRQGRNMGPDPAGESDIPVRLDRCAHEIVGHPVIDGNVFSLTPERYSLRDWDIAIEPNDAAIDVHIPAGDPLTPSAIDDSLGQVRSFFAGHVPEHSFRGLTCQSWLLDPQFDRWMPSCNIAGFAKRFCAVPSRRANDDQMWERVFGQRYPLSEAPKDNSLRRGLIDHMQRGGQWFFTDGFILPHQLAG